MPIKGFGYPSFQQTPRGYLPIEENVNTISANLKNLLQTFKGERAMMPDYGTDLDKYIFGQLTDGLMDQIRKEVSDAIELWEPRIVVQEILVQEPDEDTLPGEIDGHAIYIRITYTPKEDLSNVVVMGVLFPNS